MGPPVPALTLSKPGPLHRATGGYRGVDAQKVLMQPLAGEALKLALKTGRIRIEAAGQMLRMISTVSLAPADIPLQAKVVLCGEPMLYYLLSTHDPEFPTLFNVAADFDDEIGRGADKEMLFAR